MILLVQNCQGLLGRVHDAPDRGYDVEVLGHEYLGFENGHYNTMLNRDPGGDKLFDGADLHFSLRDSARRAHPNPHATESRHRHRP